MTLIKQRTGVSRVLIVLAAALVAGALFLGSRQASAANASVSVIDFAFVDAVSGNSTTTVNMGDTVTWTNNGATTHTVTSTTGTELAGTLAPGATYSHMFSAAGTFAYHCTIHPQMTGMVIVQQTAATATATNTTAATATNTSTATSTATATATSGTATATATATSTSSATATPTRTSTPIPTATTTPVPPPTTAPTQAATAPAPGAPRTGTTPPAGGGSSLPAILFVAAALLGTTGLALGMSKRRV